jgi:hypothetical protein
MSNILKEKFQRSKSDAFHVLAINSECTNKQVIVFVL